MYSIRGDILLTGASGLVGAEILRRLLAADPSCRVFALVRDPARLRLPTRPGGMSGRVVLLRGDLRLPNVGLDAVTRQMLARDVVTVAHAAADTVFSRPLPDARATNTEGTRHLLEMTASWRALRRFVYVSTAFVAGRRTGRILERDNGDDAGWVNGYEQSKYEAETLVRRSCLPWIVVRPSTIACDSLAGRVTRINAVHRALRLYHGGLASMMPGSESSTVDVVTSAYVADSIVTLAKRPSIDGDTFHLCAGDGAMPLGELLDTTYAIWAASEAWKCRAIARPALADLDTYRLFERSVAEAGDVRLRRVIQSLSHFVPQLAFSKHFDTATSDSTLSESAPPVREYWARMVESLLLANWTETRGVAA